MTDSELAAIRARCDAATPGPWHEGNHREVLSSDNMPLFQCWSAWVGLRGIRFDEAEKVFDVAANVEFLIHAREDIPALLAEIEHLQSEAEEYLEYAND
jgi:hypothetical protein